ncbi:MAG: isoprenylcysteine carboxylmethyltransferase family protein [Pirellulaceae bacterium]|nr:isoprenylcysteine carboxylmethyltransferase family protein [Pirellulaceae bacterium]
MTVFLVSISIGVYYRLQARSAEKISRKPEGYVLAVALRFAGLFLWSATFGYLIYPPSVGWASLPLPPWIRCLGVVIGGASAFLMYWTLSSLGKNLTDTVVTRRDATLITHGPYRWVRHPFYLTAALLMSSVALLAANWLIGIAGLLVLTLLAIRTPTEEAHLVARFGQQYRDYMDRTGRFWPRRFK